MQDYGYIETVHIPGCIPARVIAVHRDRFELVSQEGYVYGKLKSSIYYKENNKESNRRNNRGNSKGDDIGDNGINKYMELDGTFPTVGDYVMIKFNEYGDSQIVGTLERRSFFERKDPESKLHKSKESNKAQAIAANFDYVFIATSLNHDFNIGRLERYLTLAYESKGKPVIILTKADLVEDYSKQLRSISEIAPNTRVHIVSAVTGFGIELLSDYLTLGKTVVVLGSSGVGKSSLLNAIAGEQIMDVNEIREDDSKGRHTTTHRQLVRLKSGAMVIDTPGMRELGIWEITDGIEESFKDVQEFISMCKYSNCTHTKEPGCGILRAIADGNLSKKRFESYEKIINEATICKGKTPYAGKKQLKGRGKSNDRSK